MKLNKGQILVIVGMLICVSPYFLPMQIVDEIFSDGFESEFDNWTGTFTNAATLDVVTEQKYQGLYSAKASGLDEQGDYVIIEKKFDSTYTTIFASVNVRFTQHLNNGTQVFGLIALRKNGVGFRDVIVLRRNSFGSYYWRLEVGMAYYDSSPCSLSLNTWILLKTKFVADATSGEAKLWVNNVLQIDKTGISTPTDGVDELYVEAYHNLNNANASTIYWDSVEVCTDSEEPPPTEYTLMINSEPISEIQYSVNGQTGTTGTGITLEQGSYTVTMPSSTEQADTYNFKDWQDTGLTNPQRTIELTSDLTFTVNYELASEEPTLPTNGLLTIHAYVNETEIDVDIEVNGDTFKTSVSGISKEYPPGTYTITATYGNQTLTEQATLVAGETTRVDFQFTIDTTPVTTTPYTPQTEIPSFLFVQLAGGVLVFAGLYFWHKEDKG